MFLSLISVWNCEFYFQTTTANERKTKKKTNNQTEKEHATNDEWLHKYYIQFKDLSGISARDYFRQMLCELRKTAALNNSLQFTKTSLGNCRDSILKVDKSQNVTKIIEIDQIKYRPTNTQREGKSRSIE